ncbi:MAG TPA: prolipoprotein diacylglyceryl transferase [Vicinamibacterales bacterium]|nr:prolipoprotein diacylglyceryl transferase [Vicinamibacterales bacterium]
MSIAGIHLWWYGLSYTLGFLQVHLSARRNRVRLRLAPADVYALSIFIAIGVVAGGRAVEVLFDEWPFYSGHPQFVPALWLGGMATHGLLAGAVAGTWLFARVYRRPFLELADALVIPGALLMGLGRIGNFIDGQIVGSVTDVWWGVRFPDAEGVRHPVVLYDGLKNLLLIPYLLHVRRTNPTPGAAAARFVFWYAFTRIFIDLFRDYPHHRLALGTGQTLNILMALVGAALLYRSRLRRLGRLAPRQVPSVATGGRVFDRAPGIWQRVAFASILALCLTIPSNWTQDVPARYGKRHPGLTYSRLYPSIDTAPPGHVQSQEEGKGEKEEGMTARVDEDSKLEIQDDTPSTIPASSPHVSGSCDTRVEK